MTRIGTSYFVSLGAALRYYREYGVDQNGVHEKIKAGEVHLGKPSTCEPDERVTVGKDGRYYIEHA